MSISWKFLVKRNIYSFEKTSLSFEENTASSYFMMLQPVCRNATRQLTSNVSRSVSRTAVQRRYLHAPVAFDWKDPLGANNLFTEDELAIAETAESYCQEKLLPRVLGQDILSPRRSVLYKC